MANLLPAPMSPSLAQSQPSQSGTKLPPSFDFEKRKRWADLLLTELVDNVPFVLSSTSKIWFCGVAVTEILGWKDIDLIDLDFTDLIEITDQDRFRLAFEHAVRTGTGFDVSVRLKAQDNSSLSYPNFQSKAAVFDIKCHPHAIPPLSENEAEIRCMIAMVSPYPSRNTAMLNTMLDFKVQNDVLQHRLAECRDRSLPESPDSRESPFAAKVDSMYATSTLCVPKGIATSASAPMRTGGFANASQSNMAQGSMEGTRGSYPDTVELGHGSTYLSGLPAPSEDQGDESSKKKKLKRSQNVEQYVCNKCGRTDSPEWRKGPLGPKTLCNACGLRWAKQIRKTEDSAAPEESLKANPGVNAE